MRGWYFLLNTVRTAFFSTLLPHGVFSSRWMVKRALLSSVNASMLHAALGDTANILSREGNFLCLGAVLHTRFVARRGGGAAADAAQARHPSHSRLSCSSGGGGEESPDWLCRLSTTLSAAVRCIALPDAGGYSVGSVCEGER